ncbi:Obtusifoliol 14-alpha demethylase, partial [Ananas comosus]
MQPISVIFPYLPIPAHRQRDRARARLAEIFATIIKARKASGQSEEDMLQCFIDSKYKDGASHHALFAGQHTSSITSTWTGAYLLRHREFLVNAVEEQKEILKKHGEKIDHDILSEMDVLYRCIKEALRLHPPLIMLLRQSHSEFTVRTREGKDTTSQGHIVATSPAFANRLSHIYKDPIHMIRIGSRPVGGGQGSGGVFVHFFRGGGTGASIKAIWSHLLRNFEFELISPFLRTIGMRWSYKRRKLTVDN